MRITKTVLPMVLVLLVVLFSFGYTQDRPAKGAVSEKWYLLSIKGRPSGYLHAVRKANPDNLAEVYFQNEILTNSDEKQVLVKMQTVCDDNAYFFPIRLSADIAERGQAPATLTAIVEKDAPYGCPKGKMRAIYRRLDAQYNLDRDIPEHTVSEEALLEIIPRLPFVEGTVFKFNLFLISKLKVQKKHEIKYLGLEEIQVNNTAKALHKFEQKGSGIKSIRYWLDDRHQLLRILKDDKEEFLLSTQAEVKSLVEN